MTHQHTMRELLHRATHRIPGVPAHTERTPGHQGGPRHGRAWRNPAAHHRSLNHRWNHSPARPPRLLVGWQARIAAHFGQELR
ncbi:hypothetical protein ACIRRA_45510 [Nocardia sp. NPDC101769]|uniref:hypothetical protein n=1 Tax=Nocardia sp. NPDC101769 TaxID=3364333 RepID=UPI003807E0FC